MRAKQAFEKKTGLQAPRVYDAKYQSVCKCCRHRVNVKEPIMWDGPGKVYHVDCWMSSLSEKQILSADDLQPKAQRLLTGVRREPPPMEDNIPF
jgi:hypothetical protein